MAYSIGKKASTASTTMSLVEAYNRDTGETQSFNAYLKSSEQVIILLEVSKMD